MDRGIRINTRKGGGLARGKPRGSKQFIQPRNESKRVSSPIQTRNNDSENNLEQKGKQIYTKNLRSYDVSISKHIGTRSKIFFRRGTIQKLIHQSTKIKMKRYDFL